MKKTYDRLKLLKLLDKTEKVYFKKFALTRSKGTVRHRLKFIDAIVQQIEYI